MDSSTVGGKRSGCLSSIAACLILLLVVGVASSDGGYLYQTRQTEYSPNAARYGHVSLKLGDGRVGVFAGAARTDVELFDPNGEQFTTSRVTRSFTDFAGVTLPDGTALLIDGQHDCVFDYMGEQFVATQNTYTGSLTRNPAPASLPDGKVFVCGGYGFGSMPKSDCAVYDPRAMRFTFLGQLEAARVHHAAVAINDYQVLVVGGYGFTGSAMDSLELFDVARGGSARIRTALSQARYSHCCVRLADGRILIVGGTASSAAPRLAGTEIFDPNTATVIEGPSLGLARSSAQAATLPSGRIAIFGGNYDARAVEIYRPDTDTFELAQSLMIDARWSGFTATSLDSGGVLLVGGLVNANVQESAIQAAEIFEEVASDRPSAPAMTLASIRGLLTNSNPSVVSEATQWLVALGEQVVPILNALAQDESSDLSRQATSILQSIESGDYPEAWCVEVWDDSGVLDTVWLNSFDCLEYRDVVNPDRSYTAIVQATEGVDFTHLVVRFPAHASYETRVKLFNLVGWTRIPKVVLGDDLDADTLIRISSQTIK